MAALPLASFPPGARASSVRRMPRLGTAARTGDGSAVLPGPTLADARDGRDLGALVDTGCVGRGGDPRELLRQRFTFDGPGGKLASITVEPEDEGLFDYVVQSALGNAKAS